MSDPDDRAARRGRKAARIELQTQAGLRQLGYRPKKIELLDISNLGCRVEMAEQLTLGESVWLRLPGLESIHAHVAWTRDWTAGLEFAKPLHPAVLEMLLARLKG
jgi:PilZ domain